MDENPYQSPEVAVAPADDELKAARKRTRRVVRLIFVVGLQLVLRYTVSLQVARWVVAALVAWRAVSLIWWRIRRKRMPVQSVAVEAPAPPS